MAKTNATALDIGGAGANLNSILVRLGGAGAIHIGDNTISTAIGIGLSTGTTSILTSWGTGGCGIGAALPGSSGLALDTPVAGAIAVAATTATSFAVGPGAVTTITIRTLAGTIGVGDNASAQTVTVGNQTTTSATNLLGGTGGIAIGIPVGGAGGVGITGGTGSSSFVTGTGSTLGINSNVLNNTTQIASGASVVPKTLLLGSLSGTSQTTIFWGSLGCGIGAAAAGTGSLTIDTPTAATILVANTIATNFLVGPGALTAIVLRTLAGTIGIGDNPSAQTITIGNVIGATGVRVNVGSAGFGVNVAPDATALADFNGSTTRGVRFPNMTTGQKNAIANVAGLVVFDTTLSKLCVSSSGQPAGRPSPASDRSEIPAHE